MDHKIYKNVELGKNADIGDFAVIGIPPKGRKDGELRTSIGDNAVIRSHGVICAGNIIGINFQTGHGVMLRELNTIGNNVSIGTHSIVEHHVTIEDDVRVHSNAFIPEYTILKRGAWIGPCVAITNMKFPIARNSKEYVQGVIVEEHAKIGANSVILPGIKIGRNALVGAGSVVTKDVPENAVVIGNPARVIKKIHELHHKKDGVKAY